MNAAEVVVGAAAIAFVGDQLNRLVNQCQAPFLDVANDAAGLAYLRSLQLVSHRALHVVRTVVKPGYRVKLLGGEEARAIAGQSCQSLSLATELTRHHRYVARCSDLVIKALLDSRGGAALSSPLLAAVEHAGDTLVDLLLRRVARSERAKRSSADSTAALRRHVNIMTASVEQGRSEAAAVSDQITVAFLAALDGKRATLHKIPRLILVHDVDNNLFPDAAYYDTFPNHALYARASQLHDAYNIYPWEARYPALSVFGSLNPTVQERNGLLLRALGKQLPDFMFSDARQVLTSCRKHSSTPLVIDTCICSANNPVVVAQLSLQLGLSRSRVWGVSESTCAGWDKALTVLELAIAHPDAVIVCSDDSDRSLVRGIRDQSLFDGDPTDLPLHGLCFFAARIPGKGEQVDFALHETLEAARIPFFANVNEISGGQLRNGYQGMSRALDLYIQWVARVRASTRDATTCASDLQSAWKSDSAAPRDENAPEPVVAGARMASPER